ncbi:MAG: hypothetical protein Fur007_01640 [Rhodoferax sp.]
MSTLTPIHTAGIALDDRLLAAGGRLKRAVAQLNWTPDARTYGLAQLDWQTIANPSSPGVDLRTPTLPFLEALRNAQSFNLASIDLLEGAPDVLDARVRSLTLAVNHLLNDAVSVYGKYLLQDSRSALDDAIDLRVPYMPRHTLALGVNGADGRQWQWGARLVYRGLRYEDAINLTPWPANWALDLMTIWNAPDKRWSVAAGLLNLGGKGSERQFPRYVAIARYRF